MNLRTIETKNYYNGARAGVRAWPVSLANAAAFLRHSTASRSALVEFRDRRLRRLVKHAYENVTFYRSLFDRAGVHPRHIRSAADLHLIPVTTKSDLRAVAPEDLLSKGVKADSLIAHVTGGSTGEPFVIRRSWLEERTLGLIRRRSLQYYGAGSRSLVAVATFHHRPHRNEKRAIEMMFNSLGIFRVRPIFCLAPPEELIAQLAQMRPDVIGGYAGVLDRLAGVLADSGIELRPPVCVISGAEVLDPHAARRISDAFHAPVFDTYSSHEFSRIAWQCRETGEYHRSDDSVITEILTESSIAEPGGEGRMVGTALHSYSMPFIRFELGDTVTAGTDSCACGQPFSTLRKIRGRTIDYFTLPNGNLLHPYEIAAALKDEGMSWVARYELVQHTRNRIVLTAVPRTQPAAETIQKMRAAVAGVVGPAVDFQVDIVSQIDPGEAGKYRIYRSMVPRD